MLFSCFLNFYPRWFVFLLLFRILPPVLLSINVDKNVGHILPDVTSVLSSEILIAQVQFVSLCLNLNERHVPDLKSCHAPSSSPVSVSDYDAPPRGSPRCLDVRACV